MARVGIELQLHLISLSFLQMTSENIGHGTQSFYSYLEHIITSEPNTLRSQVSSMILNGIDDQEDLARYISEILNYGCKSGVVGDLVYHKDTHAFYDKYYREIEDIRISYEEETGVPIKITGDLKNHLAWFAFEYTANELYNEWQANK